MKTVAVIPCYNEARHVAGVVTEACKYVDVVLVSDGCSTDNTRALAIDAGAKVIWPDADFVSGYGASVQRGISCAVNYFKADVVVLLDGDGQHDPAYIPDILVPLLSDVAQVVMGCRYDGMPTYRRFGNRVLTEVCNIGASYKPVDTMTGYWAISAEAIPKLTEKKWGMAVELLVKCRGKGCRMASVPIRAIYHKEYADNSTVSPLRLGLALLWYVIKWRIKVEVLKKEG